MNRFMEKFTPEPNTGCWLWMGAECGNGKYGNFYINGLAIRAHRYSWEQHRGPIPHGMCVLHKCDVPACVNPDHLFLGTQKDNMADAKKKGRQARGIKLIKAHAATKARGERHGRAKLTEGDVFNIYRDARPYRIIAIDYSICERTIWQIKNGITWHHVTVNLAPQAR